MIFPFSKWPKYGMIVFELMDNGGKEDGRKKSMQKAKKRVEILEGQIEMEDMNNTKMAK